MLLYNQRKEFVGIDEDDLSALDFKNISELQNESHDFADLFVKKPGYIHNFKNFSWIDFILHSEADESKAIIHAKGTNYSCALHITPFHFTGQESGYAVIIRNLRALKGAENIQASKDLEAAGGIKSSPAASQASTPMQASPSASPKHTMPELDISLDDIKSSRETSASFQNQPSPSEASVPSSEPELELPNFERSYTQELNEPDLLDIPEPPRFDSGVNEFGAPVDIDYNAPLNIDMDVMKDDFKEPVSTIEAPEPVDIPVVETKRSEAPMLGDYLSTAGSEHLSDLVKSGTYQYDPSVAANELGLPVDLIEEFIGDFIDQAHEFHDDLYASINANDFDNVQILSHKLKGVAANLRVEDAFDVLSVVNVSKEVEEILPNLNAFYNIIAKLEGKEVPMPAQTPVEEVTPEPEQPELNEALSVEEDDTDYNFALKTPEDAPMLIDEDVTITDSDDDIYGDLLSASNDYIEDEKPVSSSLEDDDDIYGDLLGTSHDYLLEDEKAASSSFAEEEDDIYGDLLLTSDHAEPDYEESHPSFAESEPDFSLDDDLLKEYEAEPVETPKSAAPEDLPKLNFDVKRSANELGIPLDIVQEFIEDFKEQIRLHQSDFNNAITNGSIKEVNKTATLLKGMSDNLRLNEISEVLQGLQQEKDINNTTKALALLQAYADQL